MARKPRICFEGAFHHVTSRGDNKEKVFSNDRDRKRWFYFLKKAQKKFGFKLHVFVLMRNHFHLVIESSDKGTISQIMHDLNSSYTKYFNWAHKRTGHLFQNRFNSVLVDRDSYLLEVSRYVHLNPVRAGIVSRPEEYRWSSYPDYIGREKSSLVKTNLILSLASSDSAKQVELYGHFVLQGIHKDFYEFKKKLYAGLLQN